MYVLAPYVVIFMYSLSVSNKHENLKLGLPGNKKLIKSRIPIKYKVCKYMNKYKNTLLTNQINTLIGPKTVF